jgi:hypothetical protein
MGSKIPALPKNKEYDYREFLATEVSPSGKNPRKGQQFPPFFRS